MCTGRRCSSFAMRGSMGWLVSLVTLTSSCCWGETCMCVNVRAGNWSFILEKHSTRPSLAQVKISMIYVCWLIRIIPITVVLHPCLCALTVCMSLLTPVYLKRRWCHTYRHYFTPVTASPLLRAPLVGSPSFSVCINFIGMIHLFSPLLNLFLFY